MMNLLAKISEVVDQSKTWHMHQTTQNKKLLDLYGGVLQRCSVKKVFSCQFGEISQNIFLHRTPPVAAPEAKESVSPKPGDKKIISKFLYVLSKLCGKCDFPQNFHTRKLDEITVFCAVLDFFSEEK